MTDIGKRLRAARTTAGLTQQQASNEIGCTLNAVARWERGEMTPQGLYRKAVEAFIRCHADTEQREPSDAVR